MPVDGRAARGNGVHHAAVPAAGLHWNIEDVDDRVLDAKVDGFLQTPAHRSTQLGRGHVRRFDQHQLIVIGAQHRADRSARQCRRTQPVGGGIAAGIRGDRQQLAALQHRRAAVAAHDGDGNLRQVRTPRRRDTSRPRIF